MNKMIYIYFIIHYDVIRIIISPTCPSNIPNLLIYKLNECLNHIWLRFFLTPHRVLYNGIFVILE